MSIIKIQDWTIDPSFIAAVSDVVVTNKNSMHVVTWVEFTIVFSSSEKFTFRYTLDGDGREFEKIAKSDQIKVAKLLMDR